MSIKNKLIEEFESEMEELSKLRVGSEEYKEAVDGITKLADRIIEIEKNDQEASFKHYSHANENELKAMQLADENRHQWIRNVIEGFKVGGGFGLAAWAYVTSIHFEKEGTILTTEGGRTALRSLLKFMR